jgi:hypothetical protein
MVDSKNVDMESLKTEIFELLMEEVKDLWKEKDYDFLQNLAYDIALQKFLARKEENKEEHKRNLLHLTATLKGEIAMRKVKLNRRGKKVFERILITVIKTIAKVALG